MSNLRELLLEAIELLNESDGITRRYKNKLLTNKNLIDIREIPKEIAKMKKDSKTSNIGSELKNWTEDIIKKEGTTPDKEFKPSKLVNKEFYTNDSKVYLLLSFKWYPSMIYEAVIVNNKVYDVYCVGD